MLVDLDSSDMLEPRLIQADGLPTGLDGIDNFKAALTGNLSPTWLEVWANIKMGNAYDNSLRYLDDVLADLIAAFDKLEGEKYLLITADHGQLLGENGRWGHNDLQPEVIEVPMIVIAGNQDPNALASIQARQWFSHFDMGVWAAERLHRERRNRPRRRIRRTRLRPRPPDPHPSAQGPNRKRTTSDLLLINLTVLTKLNQKRTQTVLYWRDASNPKYTFDHSSNHGPNGQRVPVEEGRSEDESATGAQPYRSPLWCPSWPRSREEPSRVR